MFLQHPYHTFPYHIHYVSFQALLVLQIIKCEYVPAAKANGVSHMSLSLLFTTHRCRGLMSK